MPGLSLTAAAPLGAGGAAEKEWRGGGRGVRLNAVCGDTPRYVTDQMGHTLESHGWKCTGSSSNATLSDCTYQTDGWALSISSTTENGVTSVVIQMEPYAPAASPAR